jgi:hypothetical protein
MAAKKSKSRKNSSSSKSKQSLLAAGLAVIVADQVLAAAGQNSDVAFDGQATPALDKQIPTTETPLIADAPVEELLAQPEDKAVAERVSATAQASPEELLMASAETAVLEETAELGNVLTEEQLAELAPQGNELLLAQADIAPGVGEVAAGGAEAAGGGVSAATAGTAATAAAAISPLAILGAVGALGLAAGGGGGGGAAALPPPAPPAPVGVSGVVVDGYLAGSTVTRADGTGGSVKTDANGSFSGLTGTGAFKVSGGIDQSTGQAFTGVLYAPEGSGAITPLTTLVNSLVNSGMSADAAKAAVLSKLGLPAGFDLLNADPVALSAAGDPAAFVALKAGSAIATLLQTLGNGNAAGFGNVADSLAKLFASPGSLDLGNPAALISGLKAQLTADGVAFKELSGAELSALENGLKVIVAAATLTDMAKGQADTLQSTLGFTAFKPVTPEPTQAPTSAPTEAPTSAPTEAPTSAPTEAPTVQPPAGGGGGGSGGGSTGPIVVPASLVDLAKPGANTVVGAAGDSFLIQGGVGDIGDDTLDSLGLDFGQDLNVTLDLQPGDAATDATADGTIQLNTSLSGLAGLGIDHITGDANQNVSITGGLGAVGAASLDSLGLDFGQDLNVTLDLQPGDAATDATADGTIQLNTSLSGLAGLGIDHITGAPDQNVSITGGLGAIGDASLDSLGLDFGQDLNVTLDLQSGDALTDGFSDGTIQLHTSLAGLADLGIDHVTGDTGQDVFITGGLGNFSSSSLSALAAGGFGFTSNLDVTAGGLSVADLDGYSGGWNAATTALHAIGVDTISVGEASVSLDDISALISSGLDFAAADNISLIDSSVEGTLLAGSHGAISLDDLANLGIDTVDADGSAENTFKLLAGNTVSAGTTSADLETALRDILDKFDSTGDFTKEVFANQDNVSLDIGNNYTKDEVAGLSSDIFDDIETLGIDVLTDSHGMELWKA